MHAGDGEEEGEPECNHISQVFCNLAENTGELLVKTVPTQLHLPVAKNHLRLDNEQISAFTKTMHASDLHAGSIS